MTDEEPDGVRSYSALWPDLNELKHLRPFLPEEQWWLLHEDVQLPRRRQRLNASDAISRLAKTVRDMPDLLAADGLKASAIVYLHYLFDATHWYVTAKDPHSQGVKGELVYGMTSSFPDRCQRIDLVELRCQRGVELDLQWEPTALDKVRQDLELWQRQWRHSSSWPKAMEMAAGARPAVHVRASRLRGKNVFIPINDTARAVCRLMGRPYIRIDEVQDIVSPDGLDMRLIWLPAEGDDAPPREYGPKAH